MLTIAAAATCCTTARADGFVNFSTYSGQWSLTALSQLPNSPPADVTGRTYEVTETPGSAPTHVNITNGYTLATIIDAFGDSSLSFDYVAITAPDGREILVPRAEALSTAAGGPVLWADASGTHFADANPGDYVTGGSNEVYVALDTGSILSITASTTTTGTITPGEPVHFELDAPVTGQTAGETLTYHWVFDDGTTSSGISTSHKYLVAGTYDAYLQVTGSDNSAGYSSVIPITVGKTPTGPNRAGGGTSKKKHAPTHGPGIKGASPGHRGTVGNAGKAGKSQTTSTTSATATVRTPTTTTPGGAVRPRHPAVKRTSHPTGQLLAGIPISGAVFTPAPPARRAALPAGQAGVVDAARTGHPTAAGGVGDDVWIVLAMVAMVLSGALLELKGLRFGREPWPRSLPVARWTGSRGPV